jgi:hypothetical protein
MSCTRRGFLKTVGAAVVGLGLTRLEPMRAFATSSVQRTGSAEAGGPQAGAFSADALRQRVVAAARFISDEPLAAELSDVCCWAPAAAAIRRRPIELQRRGAQYFFQDFPGGDQLADVYVHANNTSWRRPRFRPDPDGLVQRHYELRRRSFRGLQTQVVEPSRLNGRGGQAQLDLVLDRETGERLGSASDRAEPMWAALSILSGSMLDPADDLHRRLSPWLSLNKRSDRALARSAAVRYSQIVFGAAQRAVYSDMLEDENPVMPLLELSAAGYLPLGEEDKRFYLLRVGGTPHLTGYRTGNA